MSFDSRQPPGTGEGVYMAATAQRLGETELEAGLAFYSGVSQA